MRSAAISMMFLFLLGCGSTANTSRPATVAQPAIAIRPPTMIFFGSNTTAPAPIVVDIKNTASVPLRVREIEVSSPSMVQYGLQTTRERFSKLLEPGESHEFTVFATAQTRVQSPKEPLNVRAIVTFEAEGKTFREIVQE